MAHTDYTVECRVFSYCELRAAERLFYLNRIKSCAVLKETFALPDDFEFASRCKGGKFGAFIAQNAEHYVIDFYAEARDVVREHVRAENQKITEFDDDERTRLEFDSSQHLKIRNWVLSLGANAVPVAPEILVESWKEQVRIMYEENRIGL